MKFQITPCAVVRFLLSTSDRRGIERERERDFGWRCYLKFQTAPCAVVRFLLSTSGRRGIERERFWLEVLFEISNCTLRCGWQCFIDASIKKTISHGNSHRQLPIFCTPPKRKHHFQAPEWPQDGTMYGPDAPKTPPRQAKIAPRWP